MIREYYRIFKSSFSFKKHNITIITSLFKISSDWLPLFTKKWNSLWLKIIEIPAEWEKQQGYFTFPHNGKIGQENTRSYPMGICRIYKKKVSLYETVFLVVSDGKLREVVCSDRAKLIKMISFIIQKTIEAGCVIQVN
jgi:hypothetical protein